ncbi:MAG: ABC transporter permease, partial [Candidatus Dormibacteria bacterium]
SRLLRVTPLRPAAYVAIKLASSLLLGALAVTAVYVVADATGKPAMPVAAWIATGLVAWLGALTFAALGLFIGYLLPAENVMQVVGFLIMLCSFAGGIFVPLSQFSAPLRELAHFTPLYGLNQLVHEPLLNQGVHLAWVLNLTTWLAIFTVGAAWRFHRDTARV